ncbi:MAG: DUF2147 domain-containing protein [Cyclobacteriaceae bacterium]|jgi:uncharacterized protein (DUF2147 family)|nr:DUF2147 domain-containing protein [Cyclobacteriaceae bacterium]
MISRIALLMFISLSAQAQVTGLWKSVDDQTNEVKSVVEITERNGRLFGTVVQIFPKPGDDPNPVCAQCAPADDRFQKPILGMEIIRGLSRSGTEWAQGTVLDPEKGEVYRCKIWLEGNNLKLRGYVGPFFRTQTWLRHSNGK